MDTSYSALQPVADHVSLDPLLLNKRKQGIDERSKALELSLRSRLSAYEFEENYSRKARHVQGANDRRAKVEGFVTIEKSTFLALHPCAFPLAKGANGDDSAYGQPFEELLQYMQQRPAPRAPHEDPELREDWEPSHDQRGYVDFEIADQKRRLARMGLVGRDSQRESTTPQMPFSSPTPKPTNHQFARTWAPTEKPAQTTLSPPVPTPTNHHCAPKETFVPQMWVPPKAQEQQNKNSACRGWIQQVPLLKSRARQEAEQRKLAGQKPLEQKPTRQKCEQERTRLPAAKPGSLYPGPTRIHSILPPNHILHQDDKEQSRMSERALLELHKTKLASLEVIRQHKEERDRKAGEQQQPKATLSAPKSGATKRESVKQLLAGVNRALEQKVEVSQGGAARTERVENGAFQPHSQQPHKGTEDASLKCGRRFWEKYDKSYPVLRQSPDRPIGSEFARHTGTSRGEVPHDSSRTGDLCAAVEAIDRTSGNLLEIPKTESDQDKTPILCAEQMDTGTESEENDGAVKDVVETAPLGDVDIHLEWEEVEHSLEDGWSDVQQDFASNDSKDGSSSLDLEWVSDVVSEGCV